MLWHNRISFLATACKHLSVDVEAQTQIGQTFCTSGLTGGCLQPLAQWRILLVNLGRYRVARRRPVATAISETSTNAAEDGSGIVLTVTSVRLIPRALDPSVPG